MTDHLRISGGAGGLTAKLDDLSGYARVVDRSADVVREAGLSTGRLLFGADLAQAALACPVETIDAMAALGRAATGASGAVEISLEMELLARLVRASVSAYELADAQLAALAERGLDVAGFAVGAAAVPLLLGGVGVIVANPALLCELRTTGCLDGDRLLDDVQQTIFDDPWLDEALTRMAPGMVQGATIALVGPFLTVAMSHGSWPTTDYSSAVTGLIGIGSLVGALEDTGSFRVDRVAEGTHAVDLTRGTFLRSILQEQETLADVPGRVQIITVRHPGGSAYVVQIPGTQAWGPVRGDNPLDLTTDVALEAMRDTQLEDAVVRAMTEADIPADAPVMLTGHSQGGITAAALTTNAGFMARFHVTSVVTAGAPIARFAVPDQVSVLSLEHEQDIVAKLDGRSNPDRADWVTVTRTLSDAEGTRDGVRGPAGAHALAGYQVTGHDIDVSTSPAVTRWREASSPFFSSTPEGASATRYQISRE